MRSVVVTGAARGIGREVVLRFASRGWRVGAYDVDGGGLGELAAQVPGLVTDRLDVTDPEDWQRCLAAFGSLDVLVNNAGVLVAGPFSEQSAAAQARVVDVNVKGVLHGCAAAFPQLRAGGVVVNLSSASALYGQPGLATYSATKAAVSALTEALDLEWEPHGLRVVDVLPLFVGTDMGRQVAHLPTTRTLGVRLTAAQVADAVVAAALRPGPRARGPHRAVGRQARLLALSSQVTPDALTRQVVRRLARGAS